jgi:hypothetical protein
MLIGAMCAVGDGGGRGNIPMSEGSLNILAPMCREYCVASPTKGTLDLTLDLRFGVQNAT